jgi:hypothetical protein
LGDGKTQKCGHRTCIPPGFEVVKRRLAFYW